MISVDDHLIEPPNVWIDRLPAKHRDAGPRWLSVDGVEAWHYEDVRQSVGGAVTSGAIWPPEDRPPLIATSHGGPTMAASPDLKLAIQFWTSRGFAVVDVNYRGSTGYGRAYRDALKGRWGEVDVDDVPWREELTTAAPRIENGVLTIPAGPGWGADVNEDVLREQRLPGALRVVAAGIDGPQTRDDHPPSHAPVWSGCRG